MENILLLIAPFILVVVFVSFFIYKSMSSKSQANPKIRQQQETKQLSREELIKTEDRKKGLRVFNAEDLMLYNGKHK